MGKRKRNKKRHQQGIETSGLTFGNVSNASTLYGESKFGASRGHGFAAERANHQHDYIRGKSVQLVGDDNLKNGADRVVDGQPIQTKYCSSASKSISEAFENKQFRYYDSDGNPMQIEVPSDQYERAVQAMEDRIKNGQVPGVNDPKEAVNIVRKGHYTYEQAKNIAKAGNIDSLKYDTVNGAIVASKAMGITATISFATAVWNGEDFDAALEQAIRSGLNVGFTSCFTAILSGQIMKAGGSTVAYHFSKNAIDLIGPKGAAYLVNAFRSGTNIYGAAAMKSAQKMLGNNIITGVASIVVMSSVDVVNIFRGRISPGQLVKNVVNTTASVAGSVAGWAGGASTGAAIGSIVPGIGTAVGGLVGAVIGSFFGGKAANVVSTSVTDIFIEDDAKQMLSILEQVFQDFAVNYLLNTDECTELADELKPMLTGTFLKDLYAQSDREAFLYMLLKPMVEKICQKRKSVIVPSDEIQVKKLIQIIEQAEGDTAETVVEADNEKKIGSEDLMLGELLVRPMI